MDSVSGSEGPAILQLQKWDPSQLQLNLSEYREAFISPARQILLLHSYNYEALLLPLNAADIRCSDDLADKYDVNLKDFKSLAISEVSTVYRSADAEGYVLCSNKSDVDSSTGNISARSSCYNFLGDVTSLAWGVCGDTYKKHKDSSFSEILFISGNHGVTAHAFFHPEKTSVEAINILQSEFWKGKWVEWGPCPTLVQNLEIQKFSSSCETSRNVDKNRINENGERLHDDLLSSNSAPKRYLHSFLAKVETSDYDDGIWTKYPEKPSVPCFAKVISFNLFNYNLPLPDSGADYSVNEQSWHEIMLDTPSNISPTSSDTHVLSDILSKVFGVGGNKLYKCSRIFSCNSHFLIGFVLKMVDSVFVDKDDETESRSDTLILVARVGNRGIKWLSSVKFDKLNISPMMEWADFCFSNNFLVCLSDSGFIFMHSAMSGKYVARIDVLQACGVNPKYLREEQDLQIKQVDEIHNDVSGRHGSFCDGRKFRRLLTASHSSHFVVIDAFGIMYSICAGDHMLEQYHGSEKLLPHSHNSGLGTSVSWEVGGSDIGCQRIHSALGSHSCRVLFMRDEGFSFWDNSRSSVLQDTKDWKVYSGNKYKCACLHASASSIKDQKIQGGELQSCTMRKLFLSPLRTNEDDCFCFSPLGLTQYIKRCNMSGQSCSQVVHFDLHLKSEVHDDNCLKSQMIFAHGRKEDLAGEAVGCTSRGCFYLVTNSGLSVFLPSITVSSNSLPLDSVVRFQTGFLPGTSNQVKALGLTELKCKWSPWQVEVLDRVLLYESIEEADRLCFENGWDLKVVRMRRFQMTLHYLRFDEIERSLEMLVDVDLEVVGILRLLFAAVHLMFHKAGNDNEISAASRLLALGTRFATTMIRRYGMSEFKKDSAAYNGFSSIQEISVLPHFPIKKQNEMGTLRKLHEMSHFLEIIRNLQCRLSSKFKRPCQDLVEAGEASNLEETDLLLDKSQLVSTDIIPLGITSQYELSFPSNDLNSNIIDGLAMMPVDSKSQLDPEDLNGDSAVVPRGVLENYAFPLENPKEMITRWKSDKLPLKTVVKDALLSGRLPLAVLQLHINRLKELIGEKEPHDTFTEIRDIGRSISYDLFLKGEIGIAIATLQRLGEDIEVSLKQLFYGTINRSFRVQIAEEMNKYGYLGPFDQRMMDRISLIERLYPSSNFWKTFLSRQKADMGFPSNSTTGGNGRTLHFHLINNIIIDCGEVDGVVLGSWTNVNENSSTLGASEDDAHVGYWAAAAIWTNTWDQRTTDRILLDQSLCIGIHVTWESQLDYYICHNNWDEVSKLLDQIPVTNLLDGSLRVSLDGLQSASAVGRNRESSFYGNYLYPLEELDAVCLYIPNVKIFRFSANIMCSKWLRMLIDEKLARKFVFLKEYWEGTLELVPLLARSGFVTSRLDIATVDDHISSLVDSRTTGLGGAFYVDSVQALYKVFIHHCSQHNLPVLLDLYLDHQKFVVDKNSMGPLLEAAGDCQWARWLLLSRIKGCEYEASFSNARSIMSQNLVHDTNFSVRDIDEIICTVDDIAEGGGEMAALATLMYAPSPIQACLSSNGVNRHSSSSAQCTLENLRPILQRFPTLCRALVTSAFRQDTACSFLGPTLKNALSEYLHWRDSIFFSAGRDTSLLHMLPCWFPKAVRRLIQLYVQGPLGWQALSSVPTGEALWQRDVYFFMNDDENTEISPISWEATIQKHIEDELYDSSLDETGLGLEHHLHRGRALSVFNRLLASRVQKLKSETQAGSAHGQSNIQLDLQTLFAPLTPREESLLSSIIPFAITHFENSVLVASCAFLLEICGLSASMLRIDVAALRRISTFYTSGKSFENFRQLSRKGSAFHPVPLESDKIETLARALADEYLHQETSNVNKPKGTSNSPPQKHCPQVLLFVLQHLEEASLPQVVDGNSCGSWLLSGKGDGTDGTELRNQQKAASRYWNLVTLFCRMHNLTLSTKYLALLARDNDWVGFLSEAHVGGYPFDTVIKIASKEFSDPRLKIHILTVLKGMQSRKNPGPSSFSDFEDRRSQTSLLDESKCIPVELFTTLAECEKEKNPGKALLIKAEELSWSILAMVASCFPDVSPLSCLTVWLEITAARETTSIKVNDIASQIAEKVGSAVDATNTLPVGCRSPAFHYCRKNSKRRRIMDPISEDQSIAVVSDNLSVSVGASTNVSGGIAAKEERKTVQDRQRISYDSDEASISLSKMVSVLCEQKLFLPLLRAFELFLPSCSLLPFIRALQAFSQMRLSEASAHLGSFSARVKDEASYSHTNVEGEENIGTSWIGSTAVKAANAVLSVCPSPYERRCLLKLLAATDFGDGGVAATSYRQFYWKINLAEPLLRNDDGLHLGNEALDDDSLLTALEKNGHWEQARSWAKQLEASGGSWKSAGDHVTETQAESMVAEWKEFLWDVPEERVALWGHCQALFIRYSFPALQAGLFFLKHAEAVEKDLPAKELHELLLLSLQWLSGMITMSYPVYPLHLLREIETKVWLLAVESEAELKNEGDLNINSSTREYLSRNSSSIIDWTASIISKMDKHISTMKSRNMDKHEVKENSQFHHKSQVLDAGISTAAAGNTKAKRRAKGSVPLRRSLVDSADINTNPEDGFFPSNLKNDLPWQDENLKIDASLPGWEERVGPAEVDRAVLSLLEFGQIVAAKQLQQKLSPGQVPSEFLLVDAAFKLAAISTPNLEVPMSMLDEDLHSVLLSYDILTDQYRVNPLQVLEILATRFAEGSGRGLCRRVIAVVKAANVLGLSFAEAYSKQPIELLQLLSLKAQESFEEANFLVQTHFMSAASVAQILAESFLKGLLAAHRGGYMESQKDEGPAPLLWRFSDFLKWSELCPSEPEIGHALMRLVITGQEIPHACEVELLILSHHFYKSSACLDGVDVLAALAATRVEAYVAEGDFACLARLITGVGNFHALSFILGILIENGQLELLLHKYSAAADTNPGSAEAVRGFRMAVLTSLKHFNPNDLDAFAKVYTHFDMKHETAALLESQAEQSCQLWFRCYDKDQNEDLLDAMHFYIKAAEVYSSIDAGNKTRSSCAQASLVSLQIRMPDFKWLFQSETNARRTLVEQSRFQEALIVAEAYDLDQPSEWALVIWNQMLKPEILEEFVAEFVTVFPLHPSMLADIARFYRSEVAARGDQSQFSVWLTGGGLPAEWAKYLGRSFRCLLKRTRDLRLRLQYAQLATGFVDVSDACTKALDKVPENAGPLVLRKGHGGAYLPLM